MVKRAWKALHFLLPILKLGNSSITSLACTTLVRPIFEYGAACWDPYREGETHVLDRLQKKSAKFAYYMKESIWKNLSQRRKLSRVCAFFKAYFGVRAWKATCERLRLPHYQRRADHERKIRNRIQRTDIGKYSFVNKSIRL